MYQKLIMSQLNDENDPQIQCGYRLSFVEFLFSWAALQSGEFPIAGGV